MLFWLSRQAASAATTMMTSAFWKSVVLWLGTAGFITTLGFVLSNFCLFRHEKTEKTGWKIAGIVLMVATVIMLLLSLFTIKWSAINFDLQADTGAEDVLPSEDEADYDIAEFEEEDATEELHYAFFNPPLQYDEDESNDFNFGYNPYDYDKEVQKDADWFDKDFRSRFAIDPALLAADAAYLDSVVGTRYIGVFYEGAKQDWAQAINDAKVYWMENELDYYKSIDAFSAFLDSAEKVEVLQSDGKETDMMFMNPYTVDGVPDVIVMKTDDHKGHYLVYTFRIKGQAFKVAYRIECGYQPTNVSKGMKINPVPPPSKKVDPTPDPTPTPQPTPTPTPNPKDKTKGTQGDVVKPNDDPGPGPDTNNGQGAKESKVEEHPNSTDVKDYKEYKETVQELKDTNKEQKTGSDPSTPTTPTKPGTNVDSNAEKLPTGGGATPSPAKEADTGKDIKNNADNPAGAWGGPKD
jgi:hypothetical protein